MDQTATRALIQITEVSLLLNNHFWDKYLDTGEDMSSDFPRKTKYFNVSAEDIMNWRVFKKWWMLARWAISCGVAQSSRGRSDGRRMRMKVYPEARQSASHSLRVSRHLLFSRCIVSLSRQVQSSCEYGVNSVPVSRGWFKLWRL